MGVRVPQGTVARGMGQAASLRVSHPWGGVSRATLGVAPVELQPRLWPRRGRCHPRGHSSVPVPPLCPEQRCQGLQRCQDGAGGVITPCGPPRTSPAAIPAGKCRMAGWEQGLGAEKEPFPGRGNWRALG